MQKIARLALIMLLGGLPALTATGQTPNNSSTVYTIDNEASILRVFVGRAGMLARLGHNHVVHTRDLTGQIILMPDRTESSAAFSFPVSSFIVDDSDERARAGADFESQPDDAAISGTRDNMLGEGVLNANAFPQIAVTAVPVSTAANEWMFNVSLQIQDNLIDLQIPAQVTVSADTVTADARFSLNHEDIGLSVFTALGGALSVAERIDFELHIVGASD